MSIYTLNAYNHSSCIWGIKFHANWEYAKLTDPKYSNRQYMVEWNHPILTILGNIMQLWHFSLQTADWKMGIQKCICKPQAWIILQPNIIPQAVKSRGYSKKQPLRTMDCLKNRECTGKKIKRFDSLLHLDAHTATPSIFGYVSGTKGWLWMKPWDWWTFLSSLDTRAVLWTCS